MSAAAVLEPRAPLRPTRAVAAGLGAIGVAAVCLVFDHSGTAVVQAGAAGLLVWLAAIDIEFRLVPNRIVLPATGVVLAATAVVEPAVVAERALAALAGGGFLLVAALVRPGNLGLGDVKLGLLLGAMLGSSVLTAFLIGFGTVGLVGLLLLVRDGRSALRKHLPLVPFLALGVIVTLVSAALK